MGGVIMSHGCVTVKQHEFIQDVYLGGYGNIARHGIEQAMSSRRGALSSCFKELEARERLEEQAGQFVSANVFLQHRRF
jgi:hypothetical protein